MKVLHVIPGVAPRYGGPSTVIFPLVAALNGLGDIQAEIATTDADGPNRRLPSHALPDDVPVHLFRRTCSEQWKASLGLWNWLRQRSGEYDLIQIHALWSFATAATARSAMRGGTPYVLRPAGMLSNYSWRYKGWKKQVYWSFVERRTVQGAAAFHVTSGGEASEVWAVRPHAKVFVIPNGVDSTAFTMPRDATTLRRRCGQAATGKPILLFLSRLHPVKGIVDRLLPAMATLRTPCFLAIAGAEDSHAAGHESEIRTTIKRLGLAECVAFLGPVAGMERWALFDGADLFVLPSHSESFGIVVAEAMARGCPVLVTEGVQAHTHVAAARAGEVLQGDVAALAGALDRVLSDAELRRTYGEAGCAYAAEHFRWQQIARRVRQMYAECLTAR